MSIKLNIPHKLSNVTKGKKSFDVNGKTVYQCLDQLLGFVPKLKEFLFFEKGDSLKLRSNINVLVNEKSVDSEGLTREVQNGDVIEIKMDVQ